MAPWGCFRCTCGVKHESDAEEAAASPQAATVKADVKPNSFRVPRLPVSQHSGSGGSNNSLLPTGIDTEAAQQDSLIISHDSPIGSIHDTWADADEFFTPRSHLSTTSSFELTSPVKENGSGEGLAINREAEREQGVTSVLQAAVTRLSNSALAHELQDLSDQGRFLEAHRLLVSTCESRGVTVEQLGKELESEAFDVRNLQRLEKTIDLALSTIIPTEGWHQVIDTPTLKISHKQKPGTHIHGFRSVAVLDCPVHHLLCLAREFDLLPSWIKYIPESDILKEISPHELIVYFVQWMPWPVSGRDFLLNALIVDLLDTHDCLLIPNSSIECPPDVRMPPNAAKRSRLHLADGSGFTIKPLPPLTPGGIERCEVTMVHQLDAGMPVPGFILEFVMKVFGPFVYKQACKIVVEQFRPGSNSPYIKRLAQHEHLYSAIEARSREHWQRQAALDKLPTEA